ncbi:mitochondrial 2-oxodicarboxylate carrier [Protomyces lactucae-debilis]|uniref:Mitochondrial 2-oxodicarboxylate carrier n=1 Tax=Protomyces lactucae-debilis TaxID=2754530 RepID=A0A1Y2F8P4_PROLT|nr:mitochondrial 2-oxodicarboxylate carrier [Protomyces lactucae-debilis]ORY79997.1 mitochondrial 2-oxodicarboxylate carrier [Protomyces lactucae-debilis]
MDSFVAGAVAGITEILLLYPLDVLKTRAQLSTTKGDSMLGAFRTIVKKEGTSVLYRGIYAPLAMEAPKRATKFAANDYWGQFWRKQFNAEKTTQGLAVLTGASAGATESFVVVPFELIKIRLQAVGSTYTGAFDCFKKIIATEGVLSLYNGLESTMLRHVFWNAGYFGCIFQVKALLPKPESKGGEMLNNVAAGTVGGTVGTILNTPFDVVKSRIQGAAKSPGTVPKYNWAVPALFTVAREEGVKALYKGFVPKVSRLAPGGGLMLVLYSTIMDMFAKCK